MEEQVMGEISLKEIFDVLLRWRWLIVVLTLTALISSAIFTSLFVVPVYRSSAVLMVNHADNTRVVRNESDLEEVVNQVSRPQEMSINTYVGQLNNEALLERVIAKLGLKMNARTLSGLIKTSAVKDTRLIEVSVEHNDPYTAMMIANTLSEEFIQFISDINEHRMKNSVEFLKEQKQEVDRQLKESFDKYRQYQSDPRSSYIVGQELDGRLRDAIRYQSQIIQSQVELEQLAAGGNELNRRLEQEPAMFLSYNGEQLEERNNPVYLSLTQSLTEKSVAMSEKQALVKSLERAVSLLEKQVSELQLELSEKQNYERTMLADIARLEQSSSLFAERIIQAQIAQSVDMGANNLTLVTSAVEPRSPVKPNKRLNVALAAVLGLMAAVMLAFVLEFLDNSVKNSDDVSRYLELPVLAQVPKFK